MRYAVLLSSNQPGLTIDRLLRLVFENTTVFSMRIHHSGAKCISQARHPGFCISSGDLDYVASCRHCRIDFLVPTIAEVENSAMLQESADQTPHKC